VILSPPKTNSGGRTNGRRRAPG